MSNQTPTEQDGGNMLRIRAKLPKLIISKFNGKYTDWVRFWGQFSENIDETSIAPISKFSYLRELLSEKVKHTIGALPFTPEGYNRARSVLRDKYIWQTFGNCENQHQQNQRIRREIEL